MRRRLTRQRKIILEELRKTRAHPSADILVAAVRRKMPGISVGTVYRNLNLLRDEGAILQLACGKDRARYDGFTHPHYHFVCCSCGAVLDVEGSVDASLEEKVKRRYGFKVVSHSVEFRGYCSRCRKEMRESERNDDER